MLQTAPIAASSSSSSSSSNSHANSSALQTAANPATLEQSVESIVAAAIVSQSSSASSLAPSTLGEMALAVGDSHLAASADSGANSSSASTDGDRRVSGRKRKPNRFKT